MVSLDKGRHHFSLSLQSADQGTSARDATRIQHRWSRDTVAQWHHHVRFNGTGPSKGVLAAERADAVAERGASGGRSSAGHAEAVVAAELRTAQPPSSIGIIAAVAVLFPGLFAGLTVPLPFIIGDRHSMPGTYWWQRFLVGCPYRFLSQHGRFVAKDWADAADEARVLVRGRASARCRH